MNRIGTLLKTYRQSLRLTQAEFVQNIISESFYSKVENGLHPINADNLFDILTANQISLVDFSRRIQSYLPDKNHNMIVSQAYLAYYNNDSKTLNSLLDQFDDNEDIQEHQKYIYKTLIKIFYQTMSEEEIILSKEEINSIKTEISYQDDWNPYSLLLFANTLHLFDFEDTVFFVESIIRRRQNHDFSKYSEESRLLITILINFTYSCIQNNRLSLTPKSMHLLDKMPYTPEFFFYQTVKKIYQLIISDITNKTNIHEVEIQKLLEAIKIIGYDKLFDSISESYKTFLT